jgi:hypothetical protein
MAENLYGDQFRDNPVARFFAGVGNFGRKFNEVSARTQAALVNPYGINARNLTATPTPTSGARGGASVTDDYMYNRRTGQAVNRNAGMPPVTEQIQQDGGTGGGMGANPINALFAPMFANLRQQKQQANKRYEANRNQVTNIYGQITTAREADIPALETAFKRLVDAASTRSTAVNTQIDTAEAARLAGNQAALQSMGLEGLSTSQGDVASQGAALAQQTNTLNAENWQNLLKASGVNAQEIARADVAGYNYAMLEDLGQLRGASEEFAQDLGQQRFELQSKKAQATFEYQQAQQRAAAAAKAAKQRAKAEAASAGQKAQDEALAGTGNAVPLVNNFVKTGLLAPESGTKVLDFMTEFWTNAQLPAGSTKWTTSSAKTAALAAGKDYLTSQEKTVIQAIIDATVSK